MSVNNGVCVCACVHICDVKKYGGKKEQRHNVTLSGVLTVEWLLVCLNAHWSLAKIAH